MEITEVKIKLMNNKTDRLLAFCTITLDNEFVIRDLKIIEGTKGRFVAMPSRKLADKCPKCGGKNHLRAAYCNDCGAKLNPQRATQDGRGRAKLHADIAHPINQACRERMQAVILKAYEEELARSKQPGYVPPKLEEYEFDKVSTFFEEEAPSTQPTGAEGAQPTQAPPQEQQPQQQTGAQPTAPPSQPPESSPQQQDSQERKTTDDFAAGIF